LLISSCNELKCLPASLGQLTQLTNLKVYDCPLRKLPFKKVIKGERGTLHSSIVKCMPLLRQLILENTRISEVPLNEGYCPNLEILQFSRCNDLVNVGILPNTIIELEFFSCPNLRKIKGFSGLTKLERLCIDRCQKLETLPSMETFVSLKKLWIDGCVKEKSIRGLAQLRKLISLYVFSCGELEKLEGLEQCMLLRELYILDCPKLQWGEGILEQVRQQVEDCRIGSTDESLQDCISLQDWINLNKR